MKKFLCAMLMTAFICVTAELAMPIDAVAETENGMEAGDDAESLTGSLDEWVMPEEVNPEKMTISSVSLISGDTQTLFVEFEATEHNNSIWIHVFNEAGECIAECSEVSEEDSKGVAAITLEGLPEETAEYTFGLYEYLPSKYRYGYGAVKKGTVTPMEWNGSAHISGVNIYEDFNSNYLKVYIPGEWNTSDITVNVYDGETQVGYMDVSGLSYVSGSVNVDSLMPEIKKPVWWRGYDGPLTGAFGGIEFVRKPSADKLYTIKAYVGEEEYDLGAFRCDTEPYATTYADRELMTDKPLVGLDGYGYNLDELTVEIWDFEDETVLATSESESHNVFRTARSEAKIMMESDLSAEELHGDYLVVLHNGEVITRTYFFAYSDIVGVYYDHAKEVLVAGTYGIADGTVVTATVGEDYSAVGTVEEGKLIFAFEKDGKATGLPIGKWSVEFVYYDEAEDYEYSLSASVKVMGAEKNARAISFVENPYHYAGESSELAFVIEKSLVEKIEGTFSIQCSGSSFENKAKLTVEEIVYNDKECYRVFTTLKSPVAGNYSMELRYGDVVLDTYMLYYMEPQKVYATMEDVTGAGGQCGVKIQFPCPMQEWDDEEVSLKISDILGNEVELSYSAVLEEDAVIFYFEDIPEDLMRVNIELLYAGSPVYNMEGISNALSITSDIVNPEFIIYSNVVKNMQNYYRYNGFKVLKPSVAYVTEHDGSEVLCTWEFPVAGEMVYLTEEMLGGLNYDTAEVMYDVYFESLDGEDANCCSGVYFGLYRDTIVVENGIGMDCNGDYWLYEGGKINYRYTGLYYWSEANMLIMIVDGLFDTGYTGIVCCEDTWWVVKKGYATELFTGMAEIDGQLWYVKDGGIAEDYNGLLCHDDVWYYLENGRVNSEYAGLVFVNNDWWYVQNGVIDFTFSGLAYVNNGWWYVVQGKIDFSYTGLVFFNGDWWYVEGGKVNGDYWGLAFINECWWYVAQGKIDFTYNGLYFFNNEQWYVSGGMIDFSYTGLVFFDEIWWYVENGRVNRDYYGLSYVNDTWWYVQGGIIDFNCYGLAFYNDKWWYVAKAEIDFSYTGLCFYNNEWYYIENGEWVPTYNGTAVGPDGNTYQVENGKVVG